MTCFKIGSTFLLLLAASLVAAAEFQTLPTNRFNPVPDLLFQAQGEALTASEGRALEIVLNRVNSALPSVVKALLGRQKIDINILTLSPPSDRLDVQNEIILDRSLLSMIAANPDPYHVPVNLDFKSNHHNLIDFAAATVIHSVGRIYDDANGHADDVVAIAERCLAIQDSVRGRPAPHRFIPDYCQPLLNLTQSVSQQPDFLDALGWLNYWFLAPNGIRQQGNFLDIRFPGSGALADPKEGFAISLEYFSLDPEFACREPSLYRAMKNNLQGFVPFPNQSCSEAWNKQVLVSGNPSDELVGRWVKLDPQRIYAVDYFFAGKGEGTVSRFGHAMLRLVICAPSRQIVDAHCYDDIQNHLILSFRASIEDFAVNNWKGLVGSYPSILFVLGMPAVLTEYTELGLREVTSLPLKLSRDEIAQIVDRVVELQWTYEGKYRFLSNNCADETIDFLQSTLPMNSELANLHTVRPDHLYQKLIEIGFADDSAQRNREKAIEDGFYFPSSVAVYDRALSILKAQNLLPDLAEDGKPWTVENYLELDPEVRAQTINQILSEAKENPSTINKALLALEVLEKLAMNRAADALQKQVLRIIVYPSENSKNSDIVDNLKAAKQVMRLFRSPAYLLPPFTGYGIPTALEVASIEKNPEYLATKALAKTFSQFIEKSLADFSEPQVRRRFELAKENFEKIIKRLQTKIPRH